MRRSMQPVIRKKQGLNHVNCTNKRTKLFVDYKDCGPF